MLAALVETPIQFQNPCNSCSRESDALFQALCPHMYTDTHIHFRKYFKNDFASESSSRLESVTTKPCDPV